jgi:uncharacterized protein YdeI (BOF family)
MAVTKASLWTSLSNAIKILDGIFTYGATFFTNYRAYQALAGGNNAPAVETALNTVRGALNTQMNQQTVLTPIITELARVGYNSSSTSAKTALADMRQSMIDQSETIKNRAMTFGAVVPNVGNVGDGTLFRVTKDKDALTVEGGQYPSGNIKVEIALDSYIGRQLEGKETVTIKGVGIVGVDSLEVGTCPAGVGNLTTIRNADSLLSNAIFSYTDSGTAITLTDWDIVDDTKTTAISIGVDTLRTSSNSVFLNKSNAISQAISDTATSNTSLPFIAIAQVRKQTAGSDGTVTLTLGSKTATQAVSGLSTTALTNVVIGATNENGWYQNWKTTTPLFKVELSSWSTGGIEIVNVVLAQPTLFDGLYYMLISSLEPFVSGDSFTCTDSTANTGRIQATLTRIYGEYLPHTSGAPTYADA